MRRLVTVAMGGMGRVAAERRVGELLGKARMALTKEEQGVREARRLTLEAREVVVKELGGSGQGAAAAFATIQNDLGYFAKREGDLEGAIELQTEAVACFVKLHGADHPSTLTAMFNLATTFLVNAETNCKGAEKFKALQTAKGMFVDLVEARRVMLKTVEADTGGERSREFEAAKERLKIDLSESLRKLGKCCYLLQSATSKEPDVAENYFRESVRILLDTKSSSRALKLSLSLARNDLGLHLKRKGSFSEAEELYGVALKELETSVGKVHETSLITMHNLAELLDSKGETSRANAIRHEILSLTQSSNQTSPSS